MRAVNFLHAETFEYAAVADGKRASARLFRGLKDAEHSPGKVVVHVKVAERPEEPRGMTVMPAGVAASRDGALPGVFGGVVHRERVDVAPKRHGLSGARSLDDDENAALHRFGVDRFDPPALERFDDLRAGARRFKAQFGVSVNIPAKAGELFGPFDEFRKACVLKHDVHDSSFCGAERSALCLRGPRRSMTG